MDLTTSKLFDILEKNGVLTNVYETENGLIPFAKAETEDAMRKGWFTPQMEANIASARNRTVYIPAIKPGTITVTNTPSFTIPINGSDTDKKSVTIYTLFSGFQYNQYDFRDNAVSWEQYVVEKMRQIDEAMANSKSDILETFLNTNRTQVFAGTANVGASSDFNFNTTTDLLEVSLNAQKEPFFSNMRTLMRINKRNADMRYVATPEMETILTELQKYGLANDKNLQNQMMPEIYYDHNIDNAVRWTGFAASKGSMAMVTNVLDEYALGEKTGDGWEFGVSDMGMAKLGSSVMMLQRRIGSDNSSYGNDGQGHTSVKQEVGIIHRFGLISSYNDDLTTKVADKIKISASNS